MNSTKDLLRGKITVQLISLILPLIIGNILQQFYNTIDSMIVGRYVGNTAFATVGVAGSVMNLFIFMLNGGCNGISIIFAELYGQKKWERLRRESFLLAGMLITFFYNWCAAMLQAAGDTKTPLYTLLIAMALNTVLDLVFAAEFHMGTSGTAMAMATVTAQLAASVSCVCVMKKKHSEFFFHSKDLIMDEYLMKKTAKFGLVSALHQSSLYIGKLLVQGAVNTGGTDMISAYTATMRIERFANSFSDSGAASISVFVAQNHGAGDQERVRAGLRKGWKIMFVLAVVLSILMVLVRKMAVLWLMGSPSKNVLENAGQYIIVISIFYFLCFTGSTFVGYFRGIGRVEVAVIGTILQISVRVVLSYAWIGIMGLKAVALATGIGWTVVVFLSAYDKEKYMSGAIVNMIFDLVLIYGLYMGVSGVALSTCVSKND